MSFRRFTTFITSNCTTWRLMWPVYHFSMELLSCCDHRMLRSPYNHLFVISTHLSVNLHIYLPTPSYPSTYTTNLLPTPIHLHNKPLTYSFLPIHLHTKHLTYSFLHIHLHNKHLTYSSTTHLPTPTNSSVQRQMDTRANSYQTQLLETPFAPPIDMFQYTLNAILHIEIIWMPGATTPFVPPVCTLL